MSKLMYVVLVPVIALVIAIVAHSTPPGAPSLDAQTGPTLDVSHLKNGANIKRLPETEIAEEYLH